MASQLASDPNKRGKTVYLLLNRPISWLLDYQNRTRIKRSGCNLCHSTLLQCPSPFMPAMTRKVTNLLYFPATPGDYLPHDLVPFQRHNSHLKFVRRHRWSVRYLSCRALLWVASFLIACLRFVNQNFDTKG